jgi:hypothetical protein
MNQPTTTSGARLGLVVGAIVVVAVVAAAIVNSLRPVEQLDPASPEGVVQSFLVRIEDEQYEQARDLLSAAAQAECTAADLAVDQPRLTRVVVADVREFDSETWVDLEATVFEDQSIDPSSYDTQFQFILIDENGSFRIDGLSYPYFCRSR